MCMLLERIPQFQPGVLYARVDLVRRTIELVWNPNQVQLSQIARQIARLDIVQHRSTALLIEPSSSKKTASN